MAYGISRARFWAGVRDAVRMGSLVLVSVLLANCDDHSWESEVAAELRITDCDTSVEAFPIFGEAASTNDLAVQARAFVASLDPEQHASTVYCLGDVEQYSWTNVPGSRPGGIRIGDLSDEQYEQIWTLLRSLLNEQSFKKITFLSTNIENSRGSRRKDDYTFALFVGSETDWALQFDGHHLALNFLISANRVVLSPAFIGVNPNVLNDVEPLQEESAQGERLFAGLDEVQKGRAEISGLVGEDVRAGSGEGHIDYGRTFQFASFDGQGLPVTELSEQQLELLRGLVRVYVDHLRDAYSQPILNHVFSEVDNGFFVFSRARERIYYRVYIPDVLLIEYNDVSTRHIHTVTRLLGDDEFSDYGNYARFRGSASTLSALAVNNEIQSERTQD